MTVLCTSRRNVAFAVKKYPQITTFLFLLFHKITFHCQLSIVNYQLPLSFNPVTDFAIILI